MPGDRIKIDADDGGSFGAYVSLPGKTPEPGVVILHEIFGVTDWITETADLFAAHGYCVIAPDMFWRMEPNFVGDHLSAEDTARGRRYKAEIDMDKAMDDLAATIARLKSMPGCNGRVAVTGFCTGGTMTDLAAARLRIDAASVYYGTQVHEYLGDGKDIACPTIFHMGDSDDRVPADTYDLVKAAVEGVPDVALHLYEAGHAFANTHRPELYSEAASLEAHARTFELFDRLR